jgi:hemerythrin-like domain-containing protein
MSADDQTPLDTRDMVALHSAFTRALSEAPAQIGSAADGDTERAGRLAAYLGDVLWLIHAHHEGEDELLYPLLAQRAPQHQELFRRMEAQHAAVSSSLEAAEGAVGRFGTSGSETDGRAMGEVCQSLLANMAEHLIDEELEVLPIASRLISPVEWGAMPAHALSRYGGDRVWLPFGLALEAMPDDIRENLLSQLPLPVSGMWLGGGADAFAQEMAAIRGAV